MSYFMLLMWVTLCIASSSLGSVQASSEGCVDAGSSPPAQCNDGDPLLKDWRTVSNYSGFPETVAARFVDQHGEILSGRFLQDSIFLSIVYVRLECHGSGDANQENITGKVCYASNSLSSSDIGGPYIFDNFTNSGIMSGWMCKIVGCFYGDDAGEVVYYRSPRDSYTIPDDFIATTDSASSATTTSESVTKSATTKPLSEDTSSGEATVVYTGNDTTTDVEFNFDGNLYIYIITATLLAVVCTVILLHVLGVVLWKRQSRLRKRILLTYNKENMVFDPDFYPAVIIEKPTLFPAMRSSNMSLDLLQSLNPKRQCNLYIEDGLTNKKQLSFENKVYAEASADDDSSIFQSPADDATSIRTLTITDHGYVSSSDGYGGSKKMNALDSGYLLEANTNCNVQSLDDTTGAQNSNCEGIDDDNLSCLTLTMSHSKQIESCSSAVESGHPFSDEYVHVRSNMINVCPPTGPGDVYPMSSNHELPEDFFSFEAGQVDLDLDVDLDDETKSCRSLNLGARDPEVCTPHTVPPPMRDSVESSHYVSSCTPSSGAVSEYDKTSNTLIKLDDPYLRHTNSSYVFLNPPSEMVTEQDPETHDQDVSVVKQSNFGRDNSGYITSSNFTSTALSNTCSAVTSPDSEGLIKTDSLSVTDFGSMADVHKYIPSEELTRTILVPPGTGCPIDIDIVETGFTVHLDFNDGTRLQTSYCSL